MSFFFILITMQITQSHTDTCGHLFLSNGRFKLATTNSRPYDLNIYYFTQFNSVFLLHRIIPSVQSEKRMKSARDFHIKQINIFIIHKQRDRYTYIYMIVSCWLLSLKAIDQSVSQSVKTSRVVTIEIMS